MGKHTNETADMEWTDQRTIGYEIGLEEGFDIGFDIGRREGTEAGACLGVIAATIIMAAVSRLFYILKHHERS